ncbi:MAG: spondin domain-containing protein [Gammaproteobacteria bacterium]|nr:spondin domain-containing protein [Gammaproteobacteria bacterium]MBQ0838145.1 spondin domain-containing protein [Gammaproteobacteria bacterium]
MLKATITNLLLCCTFNLAYAEDYPYYQNTYQVTITNITPGQTFTPQLLFTHTQPNPLFTLGEAANSELEMMAEGGDTGPLALAVGDSAIDMQSNEVLLAAGETTSTMIHGNPGRGLLTVVAMLIPTNDTFIALNGMRLPRHGSVSYMVPAYDAGTEYNDQNCLNIPGPVCGGEGYSAQASDLDEGFVHIGNGFHDLGDNDGEGNEVLKPQFYDWDNAVAKITITKVNQRATFGDH